MIATPSLTESFATLAGGYDVVLSDVWGVVHNGAVAFAEACDALARFRDGGGTVVMVASMLATMASPRLSAYGASKGGLVQLTRTLAREWADRGVRVNALGPGYIPTELNAGMLAHDRLHREIIESTPMGRLGELREVVAPALFLASDDASYITGQALYVDGGTSA